MGRCTTPHLRRCLLGSYNLPMAATVPRRGSLAGSRRRCNSYTRRASARSTAARENRVAVRHPPATKSAESVSRTRCSCRRQGKTVPGSSTRGSRTGRPCARAECGKMPPLGTAGATLSASSKLSMARTGWPILLTMQSLRWACAHATRSLTRKLPRYLIYPERASERSVSRTRSFMRQAGEYGVRGVTYTGRDSN